MQEYIQDAKIIPFDQGRNTPMTNPVPYFDLDGSTKETFFTDEPYAYLYALRDNPFDQQQELVRLSDHAKTLGYRTVTSTWRKYLKSIKEATNLTTGTGQIKTLIEFSDPPGDLLLDSGDWIATDDAIFRHIQRTGETETACDHPIMPITRYRNIDDGSEKLQLAFKRGGDWRTNVIADKYTLASPQQIVKLADQGISVTSENARALIRYLQDVESLNYDTIPTVRSTSRLGWVSGGAEFLPYCSDIHFDGEFEFQQIYRAIKPTGDFQTWADTARSAMRQHVSIRIAMAASFASVLLSRINALPSFVHLWTGISGAGKTVIAMLAASVWGNPEMGQYTQSFNSTDVADEQICGMLSALPLVMDELQVAKDRYGKLRFSPYKIAQGVGRRRGKKTGGVQQTLRWHLFCITTGESPITDPEAGAGALARVVDVELDRQVIDLPEGQRIVGAINDNYGHAGKMFIDAIQQIPNKELLKRYNDIINQLAQATDGDLQSKQVATGAALLLGAELADEHILHDEQGRLTMHELAPFLLKDKEVSLSHRGLNWAMDFIGANSAKFQNGALERYGEIEGDHVYWIRTEFNRAAQEAGLDARALVSTWAKNGYILTHDSTDVKRFDIRHRIDGVRVRCIVLKMSSCDDAVNGEQEEWLIPPNTVPY